MGIDRSEIVNFFLFIFSFFFFISYILILLRSACDLPVKDRVMGTASTCKKALFFLGLLGFLTVLWIVLNFYEWVHMASPRLHMNVFLGGQRAVKSLSKSHFLRCV